MITALNHTTLAVRDLQRAGEAWLCFSADA